VWNSLGVMDNEGALPLKGLYDMENRIYWCGI
jgi:hypothetical protein